METLEITNSIERAAALIRKSTSLLITAGAGIGVDSGLPDFRSDEGFWKAYPPLKALGLNFFNIGSAKWFDRDPRLAWGFYAHPMNLYRDAVPHEGFDILREWAVTKSHWVFTSNVDGHFQKAGFEHICEVHGSLHYLQCATPCSEDIWDVGELNLEVEKETLRVIGDLPQCPHCGGLARPNVLMFEDSVWSNKRSLAQQAAMMAWLETTDISQTVILEIGAGHAIPTVRAFSEYFQELGATLIRINVRDSEGPAGTISLPVGAREALVRLRECV